MKYVIILVFVFMALTNCVPVFSQIIDDFQVNDLPHISSQELSSIAVDDSGNFLIAWVDMRGYDFKIYAKRFNNDGVAMDSSFRVGEEDSINFFFTGSATAIDGEGNFIILWHAFRDYIYFMFVQRFSKSGEKIGENIVVNDNSDADAEISAIVMNRSGDFVVVWEDKRNRGTDIYAQLYNSDGTPVGSNFQVNDAMKVQPGGPSVSISDEGQFVVVWRDDNELESGIFARRYDSDGTPLGDIFLVDDDLEYSSSTPNVASDSIGDFIITWSSGPVNEYSDIYVRRYLSDGTALGSSFRVNDVNKNVWNTNPEVSVREDGNFIICWEYYRTEDYSTDVFAQCFSSDGIPLGKNFCVTKITDQQQGAANVKLLDNRIYSTWTSNHENESVYNIWCNVLDWDEQIISSLPGESFHSPKRFSLGQNYPNPFNPKTIINYELPITNEVELSIYDQVGQKVLTLVSERQNAGTYQVEFDAGNLASGVYFYQIQIGAFRDVKKMVVIK